MRKAADALGYQADLQARSLRRSDRRSQSIGLIVSSVANPFDAELHAAIEEEVWRYQAVVLAGGRVQLAGAAGDFTAETFAARYAEAVA